MDRYSMKFHLILLCFLVVSLDAHAQNWYRTAGPVEDDILDLCIDSNGILYAVTPLGVNRSTNGGGHWTRPFVFPTSASAGSITVAPNGSIVVSSGVNIYLSMDGANSFVLRDSGIGGSVSQIATTSSGRIFVAHLTRFVYSDDNGASWRTASDEGMLEQDEHPVLIAASHDTVITLNQTYMYASFNNGATWEIYHGSFQL